MLELLLQLNRIEGTTFVLVTHDPVLADYAGRRIVLEGGSIDVNGRGTLLTTEIEVAVVGADRPALLYAMQTLYM